MEYLRLGGPKMFEGVHLFSSYGSKDFEKFGPGGPSLGGGVQICHDSPIFVARTILQKRVRS